MLKIKVLFAVFFLSVAALLYSNPQETFAAEGCNQGNIGAGCTAQTGNQCLNDCQEWNCLKKDGTCKCVGSDCFCDGACTMTNHGPCGSCAKPKPPPSCTPSCGACSKSCGGGTQTCTRSDCSTYTQSCNTQSCGSPPPPPPPGGGGGWGGCGSCTDCARQGECVLDPEGRCLWDPGLCGGGGGGGGGEQICTPGQKELACGARGCPSNEYAECNKEGEAWNCVFPCERDCTRTICSGERCVSQSYKATSCDLANQCSSDRQCCINDPPSSPSLKNPSNGATIVVSPATFEWSHDGNFGENCDGNRNEFRVYMEAGDTTPDNIVCNVGGGTRACSVSVSDRQTYYWKVVATNGVLSAESSTWAFNVLFHAGGWFQVQDTDLGNPGNLISRIPPQCTGQCTPQFNLQGGGGFPGVPAYGGTNVDFDAGSVSGKGWLANTGYSGRRYNYAFFSRVIPSDVVKIGATTTSGDNLVSLATKGEGKTNFLLREGDLTITSRANIGSKRIVLFVTGNLNIEGRVTVDDGSGFFGAIVRGNINIHPQVSHPNQPALEGLFMADGTISTGTQKPSPDSRLYVRGALVGWGGVNLQRDLDPTKTSGGNNTTPAEFIEYAPDLIMTFPRELLREGIVWREVAP